MVYDNMITRKEALYVNRVYIRTEAGLAQKKSPAHIKYAGRKSVYVSWSHGMGFGVEGVGKENNRLMDGLFHFIIFYI